MRPRTDPAKLGFWAKVYLFMVLVSLGLSVVVAQSRKVEAVVPAVTFGVTLVFGCAALVSAMAKRIGYRRSALVAGVVLLLGAIAQLTAIYWSFPFGGLQFTAGWEPVVTLSGGQFYPLMLPFLWLMLVGSCYLVAARRFSPSGAILAAAAIAAIVDWPMEPVMVRVLRFWEWDRAGPLFGVPVQNALGWFLVASLSGMALRVADAWEAAHAGEAQLLLGAHILLTASHAYLGGLWAASWTNVAVFLGVVLLFPSRPGTTVALVGPAD